MNEPSEGQAEKPRPMTEAERAEMRLYIEWVEKNSLESLRFHVQSAEIVSKEANTTLALYLSGAGAALAGAVSPTWACLGILVKPSLALLALALFVCAAYLLQKVLAIRKIDVPTNSPHELLQFKADGWDRVRLGELEVISGKIKRVAERNRLAGAQLNNTRRIAIACAAVVSIVAFTSLATENLSDLPRSCRSGLQAEPAKAAASSDQK